MIAVTDVHLGSGYIFSGDAAPASSSAPGETGEIRIDANFIYVCVAPNHGFGQPFLAGKI